MGAHHGARRAAVAAFVSVASMRLDEEHAAIHGAAFHPWAGAYQRLRLDEDEQGHLHGAGACERLDEEEGPLHGRLPYPWQRPPRAPA
jgi:hypothetical protein